jgi:hypothetical protein
MSNVEFVMEVNSSLSEKTDNGLMKREGSLDDYRDIFLNIGLEFLEVTNHESVVNGVEGVLFRERNGTSPEMSLVSGINKE